MSWEGNTAGRARKLKAGSWPLSLAGSWTLGTSLSTLLAGNIDGNPFSKSSGENEGSGNRDSKYRQVFKLVVREKWDQMWLLCFKMDALR